MSLIVKNVNSEIFADANLNDIGFAIPIGGQDWIRPSEYQTWAISIFGGNAEEEILNGKLVLNLDEYDLNIEDATSVLRAYHGQMFNEYSWRIVPSGRNVRIKYPKQMLSYQEVSIEDISEIDIEGEMVILD